MLPGNNHTAALLAILAFPANARAQPVTVPTPGPLTPTESRVQPLKSGFRGLQDRVIGFGIYKETTQYRTRQRYSNEGYGASFSFDQHMRGAWSGGLQARWSLWEPREGAVAGDGSPLEQVAPLAAFSRVQYSPRWSSLWGERFDGLVRPFATGGIGYVVFFEERPTYRRAKSESSESAATFGGGVRLVWPGAVALRLALERWRGLRSFRNSALMWQMEVQFGDVDAL